MVSASKLYGMFYTYKYEDWFREIAPDVQKFLVVIGTSGVLAIECSCLVEPSFSIVTVKEFSISKIKIGLNPVLYVRYIP